MTTQRPPHSSPPTRVWALACALSLLACALLWGVTSWGLHAPIVGGDGHYVYLTARSVAFDGDLDLTNQYLSHGDRWGLGRWPAQDGTRFPPRELLPSLLMAAGLWLGQASQAPPELDPLFACTPVALLLGLTYVLCFAIMQCGATRQGPHSGRAACPQDPGFRARSFDEQRIAALVIAATPLPFYSVVQPAYSHAVDACVCSLLLIALLRWQALATCEDMPRNREALRTGSANLSLPGYDVAALRHIPFTHGLLVLAMMLCVLTRVQNVLWLVWPLTFAVSGYRTISRPAARRAVVSMLIGAGLGLGPQAVLALRHPGSATGPLRWGLDFFNLDHLTADLGTVLLGWNGLLTSHPVVVIALVALLAGCLGSRRVGVAAPVPTYCAAALVTVIVFVLLMATVRDPDGGASFGARRLTGLVPVWVLGFGVALQLLRARGAEHFVPESDLRHQTAQGEISVRSCPPSDGHASVRQHTASRSVALDAPPRRTQIGLPAAALFAVLLAAAAINLTRTVALRGGPQATPAAGVLSPTVQAQGAAP